MTDHDHVDRVRELWARERPDLDTGPMAVVARLGRCTEHVDRGVNEWLAAQGLNRAGWDVLASLRRSGPPYRLSPTALYRGLMRTSGAMTNRLARLERAGLIERVPDPRDGRGLLVGLTAQGRRLTDELAGGHLENERRLLSPLSRDEQVVLADLLKKLLLAFERGDDASAASGETTIEAGRDEPAEP